MAERHAQVYLAISKQFHVHLHLAQSMVAGALGHLGVIQRLALLRAEVGLLSNQESEHVITPHLHTVALIALALHQKPKLFHVTQILVL